MRIWYYPLPITNALRSVTLQGAEWGVDSHFGTSWGYGNFLHAQLRSQVTVSN